MEFINCAFPASELTKSSKSSYSVFIVFIYRTSDQNNLMPSIKQLTRLTGNVKGKNAINWFPGHMFVGMQTMMGKLNTVDCVIEVHDARIPFTGRNVEFRKHLGSIKPRLLVLNKSDLADLSKWSSVKDRLAADGDPNVVLTDMTGSHFSHRTNGYRHLLESVLALINQSDRFNRQNIDFFQIMIVGVPNVGKSTLVNRLRQLHLGRKGEPAKIGSEAGVTKHVENRIKICSRPPIYSFDTPGVLGVGSTKNHDQAMRLALCSNINDKVLDPVEVATYLLKYLNDNENFLYQHVYKLENPAFVLEDLMAMLPEDSPKFRQENSTKIDPTKFCWDIIKTFRRGELGRVMFD